MFVFEVTSRENYELTCASFLGECLYLYCLNSPWLIIIEL